MKPATFMAVFALATAASRCAAQQTSMQGDSAFYWSSVRRGLAGDTLLDFAELRFAFGRLKLVSPARLTETLARARQVADPTSKRAIVDSVIAYNFAWAPSQKATSDSLRAFGDTARAELHAALWRGLLASMEADRVRPGSRGIRVIGIAEEYVYMRSRGLEMESQGLGPCGEYDCDTITARRKSSNETETLTFILLWRKRGRD